MTEHKTLRFRVTGPKEEVLEWMDRLEEEVEQDGYFINFREHGKFGKQGFYRANIGFTTDPHSKEHFNENNNVDHY